MTMESSPQGEYRPTSPDELTQEAARLLYEDPSNDYNRFAFLLTTRLNCQPAAFGLVKPDEQLKPWRKYANEQYEIANGEPSPLSFKVLKTWGLFSHIVPASFTFTRNFNPTNNEELIRAILDRDGRVCFTPTSRGRGSKPAS